MRNPPLIPDIIADLADLTRARNLAHAQELAGYDAALHLAAELLVKRDAEVERLTGVAFRLLDKINRAGQ